MAESEEWPERERYVRIWTQDHNGADISRVLRPIGLDFDGDEWLLMAADVENDFQVVAYSMQSINAWSPLARGEYSAQTSGVQRIDCIPSHKSPAELGEPAYIQINRQPFRVPVRRYTGAEIRAFPDPPIPDDHDLFLIQAGLDREDLRLHDDDGLVLDRSYRFFSAPRHINAGAGRVTDDA